jgi:hypothetical protein
MDELFSCRNCIHNCGQSLLIGPGSGFCLQHESVIWADQREPWIKSIIEHAKKHDEFFPIPEHHVLDEYDGDE